MTPQSGRRLDSRFPRPPGTTLRIHRSGVIARLFGRNLVRTWLDVSLGGLRVLLTQEVKKGEILEVTIVNEAFKDVFDVLARVSSVAPSEHNVGCFLVAMEFVKPRGALRAFLGNTAEGGPGGLLRKKRR